MFYDCLKSEIGTIHLLADDVGLRQLTLSLHHPFEQSLDWVQSSVELEPYKAQIQEYLAGERRYFTLPLAPDGSEFQHKVWQHIEQIPFGETRSCGELAAMLANPHAMRAIIMAANVNPIPIIIPCHRVTAIDGNSTHYHYGAEIRAQLLSLEKNQPERNIASA
ncbi:methylated-DNA--[protein]-cysteine S-methyltransferase [Veronia pacifica]|uniref:methylated-DNA--[protein]-cysteine S-methyltransferase n=1 Tax=Veronia pacifica TaxID=1080227 RepID=A0A1C3EM65_9GAMM|nr:methylated-DNA--[protein]-cysteine S-methyltransferase [Veronia pacifica]ODA34321.1 6-O-methylguanine DNA methyltransferase [Veronia pacifica]